MSIKQINSLRETFDKYDTFFVDLWGVIHDGVVTYPGVHEALSEIKNAGKKIIFISNAPRRSIKVIEKLQQLNIERSLYDHVVTSGEVVYKALTSHTLNLGKKFIIVGPERDAGLMDNTEYVKVASVADADFMIITGFDHDDATIDEKQPYLDAAIKRNMPLICANPDFVIVRITGKRALCAGTLAQKYEEMGGTVFSYGKPYSSVYQYAIELAGNPPKDTIAAIGDSLVTDIKGAFDFGIDSYLIPGGIHAEELHIRHGQLPDQNTLQAVCNRYNIAPTGVLPEFLV